MKDEAVEKVMELFRAVKYEEDKGSMIYDGAIVDYDVILGKGNLILPGTNIVGNVKIGNKNIIGPYATIGAPPQHLDYYEGDLDNSKLRIEIGDENMLREHISIHAPTVRDTKVGSRCLFMTQSHVAHDDQIGDRVVLTNNVALAGHVSVMDYANIGLGSDVHQFSTIGAYSMLGMHSVVTKDIPPFALYNQKEYSESKQINKINKVGMKRNGLTEADISSVEDYYTYGTPMNYNMEKIMNDFTKLRKRNHPERPMAKIFNMAEIKYVGSG